MAWIIISPYVSVSPENALPQSSKRTFQVESPLCWDRKKICWSHQLLLLLFTSKQLQDHAGVSAKSVHRLRPIFLLFLLIDSPIIISLLGNSSCCQLWTINKEAFKFDSPGSPVIVWSPMTVAWNSHQTFRWLMKKLLENLRKKQTILNSTVKSCKDSSVVHLLISDEKIVQMH